MLRTITVAVIALLAAATAYTGFHLTRSYLAIGVYRDRLASLAGEYEQLRDSYNEAVKRTAVTELLVQDGKLCVAVRTADGQEKVINTDLDPSQEIFVDYVVIDGRLWIRRVFEFPGPKVKLIDPKLADIEWDPQGVMQGKAVYRPLTEGRWIVTVTGDGSLGLSKRSEDEKVTLSPPPPVRDYPQLERQIDGKVSDITVGEVLQHLVGSDGK